MGRSVAVSSAARFLTIAAVLVACWGCSPWEEQDLGTEADFRDVFFLDRQRGWIVGGRHTIQGGIIGRTEDGGNTWTFRSDPVHNRRRAKMLLHAVRFLDERTGIIVASAGRILRTVDGGTNWHIVYEGGGPAAHLRDLHFIDSRQGWAVGGRRLLRTTDAGATWERSPLDLHGLGVHFVDAQRGCLVGKSGAIRVTADGGKTWSPAKGAPEPGGPDLTAVYFAGARHGWVVGELGTVLYTSDGGSSWLLQESGTTARLTVVQFVSPLRGWAVGYERDRKGTSTVLQTDDGGLSWTTETRVYGEEMHALFFLDPRNGWVVGDRVRPGVQKILRYEEDP